MSYLRASGRRRHDRRIALEVVAVLAGSVVVGAVARVVVPAPDAAAALLLTYEALLIGAAIRLAVGLRPAAEAPVADLVVELGEGPSEVLPEAFARALRDPTVRFGYWGPARSAYLDGSGAVVAEPVAR